MMYIRSKCQEAGGNQCRDGMNREHCMEVHPSECKSAMTPVAYSALVWMLPYVMR